MTDKSKLKESIVAKYGNCYWDELYASVDEMRADLKAPCFIVSEWEEFGVLLAEVADNNMWSCIVAAELK